MSGRRRRCFRRDEAGVSEVVGYLMAFSISFIVLISTMAAFTVLTEQGARVAAQAELQDVANRVASSALDTFIIGNTLRETEGSVDSGHDHVLTYQRSLDILDQFRGFFYSIELDNQRVVVRSTDGTIEVDSTIFKAEVVIKDDWCQEGDPLPAVDMPVVCHVGGSVPPGSLKVTITYRFDPDPEPPGPRVNEIRIS